MITGGVARGREQIMIITTTIIIIIITTIITHYTCNYRGSGERAGGRQGGDY
jgi:hypothetical protein